MSGKLRALIYVVTFLATAILTYNFAIKDIVVVTESSTMGEASLPVVFMETESGLKYNYLYGYTCDVVESLEHDAITPVGTDRNFTFYINPYRTAIKNVSYEIRSLDGQSLIERNEIKNFNTKDSEIVANVRFRNLMENNTEYQLKIILATQKDTEINYFTRIVLTDNAYTERKLTYVNNFSDYTMSDETLNNIAAKLETSSLGDNTNLGRVTIHSKLSQVGFGGLNPYAVTPKYITLNEVDGNVASVTVRYVAETSDETGTFRYTIKEFYRINQPDDTVTYVYSFDRFMDQRFDPESSVSTNGDIYFGICSDEDFEYMSSGNGKITVFERDGSLFAYDASDNAITELYTFRNDVKEDFRENIDEHGIRIMDVSNDGAVKFAVYGYMNKGAHEGENGVSICSYDAENNTTKEIVFIPRTDPYEVIRQDVYTLSYINENNILYIYEKGTIYYLDCETKEYMVVADNVIGDTCIKSDESPILIYQTGDNENDCKSFFILHLDTGEINELMAREKCVIKALGYLDGNIVYGEAKKTMVKVNSDGNVDFPMFVIKIISEEQETIKEYRMENVFVLDVEMGDAMITLKRVNRLEDGSYALISDDKMFSNVGDTKTRITISERATDIRQKEKYLTPVIIGSSSRISYGGVKYEFSSDSKVFLGNPAMDETEQYYVFGFGDLYSVSDDFAASLHKANESGGVVLNKSGKTLWTRYKSIEHSLSTDSFELVQNADSKSSATNVLLKKAGVNGNSETAYQSGDSIFNCLKTFCGDTLNLTGATVAEALYYVSNDCPVMVKTGADVYEIIYGYTRNNVYTYSFLEGTIKTYGLTDFENLVSSFRSVMMVIYK